MAKLSTTAAVLAGQDCALPEVQLELHQGTARPTTYTVSDVSFLIGSVPGCDLRLPGANLPPLLCMIVRRPGGVALRKLSLTHAMQLNGTAAGNVPLNEGDRLSIAGAELVIHVKAATAAETLPVQKTKATAEQAALVKQVETARQQLQQQMQAFRQQVVQFDAERKAQAQSAQQRDEEREAKGQGLEKEVQSWRRRAEQLEREGRQHQEAAEKARAAQPGEPLVPAALLAREKAADQRARELQQRHDELDRQTAELERQRQELTGTRQELADIRRQLYEHYQERRDRLAGLQEAVNTAAKKVQERKKKFDAEVMQLTLRQQAEASRQAEIDGYAGELDRRQIRLDDQQRLLEEREKELQKELADRLAKCQAREQQQAVERQTFEEAQAQHRADLVRLDRLQGALDARDKQTQARAADLDTRQAQLQADRHKLEGQVIQLDEWHSRLCAMAEQLARQKQELDVQESDVGHRVAALEGQQTMLANLRGRLEQMKDEVRKGEQQLATDRARQESLEEVLKRQQTDTQQLQAELQTEKAALEQERRQVSERSGVLETAVSQLRQTQEKLTAAETRLRQEQQEVSATSAAQQERIAALDSKESELQELQHRVEADRHALAERLQLLSQAEQARESLQEQLRRRSEELSARQKALDEAVRQHQADAEAMQQQRADFEREHQEVTERVATHMQEIESRAQLLVRQAEDMKQRESAVAKNLDAIREQGQTLAAQREQLAADQENLRQLTQHTEAATAKARAEFEAGRREALELQQRLPDLELRAGTAFERLNYAREQLREYIGEVHTFANQCQEHLEGVRTGIQTEGERLQTREQALRRQQDDQRLALAGFRQQIIDWQGQIADFKRLLAENETRLERRHAEVAERAKQMDQENSRLVKQAEDLEQQQRDVATQRDEMTYHLNDMRDWYRKKLRELAGLDQEDAAALATRELAGTGEEVIAFPGRDILSLTGDVEPADRQLGKLLQSLGLIDAETLTALLVEARRQRRALRQVLLTDGTVTVYQMGLIEAGDLDALMLGNVRVVDRLRVTPREIIYQVFDPRRGKNALLRHLGEQEMADAIRPDEFRQRFTQAMIVHPNLSATWEVVEIAGRPAVLQEWLTGLPGGELPDLAAVPGVWFRLLSQAALALHTAHETGLVHGHLRAGDFMFTPDGMLKLCNLGEPPWLADPVAEKVYEDAASELLALGRIAVKWAGPTKGRKAKPLPEPLAGLLQRLRPGSEQPFATAAELVRELATAGELVPPNAEAWSRFLLHARNHARPDSLLKQSA